MQFHNYTFLPYEHHLTGSVSQTESLTKPNSEDYARVQHQTNHGDVWPADQIMALAELLMTWCVPNNHQWSFTQTPTIQCLPPRVVMQLQRRELKFDSPSLAHKHRKKEITGNTRPTLLPSHRVMVTWLVKALYIVNKGNYPAKRVCMTVIRGLSQISYD